MSDERSNGFSFGGRGGITFEVTAPKGAHLDISAVSSDVDAHACCDLEEARAGWEVAARLPAVCGVGAVTEAPRERDLRARAAQRTH